MTLAGLSAIVGALGALVFITNMVCTVMFGKKKVPSAAPAAAGEANLASTPSALTSYGSEETMEVPGTFILAMIFFVSFVLYYFINWKYLSQIWGLS